MKLTIENTGVFFDFYGIPTRMWNGVSEDGVQVTIFVAGLSVNPNQNLKTFEEELIPISCPPLKQKV